MTVEAKSRGAIHPFTRLSNFRDIGGMRTIDGRIFKSGVLYRSDELSRLTDQDVETLKQFNIKLICDLRSPEECHKKKTRIVQDGSMRVVNVPLHDQAAQEGSRKKLFGFLFGKTGGEQFRDFCREYYHHIAFEQTTRVRDAITLLASEENLPALIHCTAGKDRTGFLAAVIQLLVGVSYETVMADYLRTNDYFKPRLDKMVKVLRILTMFQVSPERVRLILMAHPDFLREVHDVIVQKHGSVESYLREACELDQSTLSKMKNLLLT